MRKAKLFKSQNINHVGPSVWVGSSPPLYEENDEDYYYSDVSLFPSHVLLFSKIVIYSCVEGAGFCF
jgi:hypothetical protein